MLPPSRRELMDAKKIAQRCLQRRFELDHADTTTRTPRT